MKNASYILPIIAQTLISISVFNSTMLDVSATPSTAPDGISSPAGTFAGYFTNMASSPCSGNDILVGFIQTPGANYLKGDCRNVGTILSNYLGAVGVAPAGQAVIGFNTTTGLPVFGYVTDGWGLTGSTNTDPTVNFLGTTDNKDLVIKTNSVERMRVLAGGNMGIGTNAPGVKLDVYSGSIRSSNGTNEGGSFILTNPNKIGANFNQWALYNMTNGNGNKLSFWGYPADGTPGQERLSLYDNGVIFLSGSVGIGTSTPQVELHVKSHDTNADIGIESISGYKWTMSTEDSQGSWILNRDIPGTLPALVVLRNGNMGINITSPNATKGAGGYLDVKDVYIRDAGKWASEIGNLTFSCPAGQFLTGMNNGTPVCASATATLDIQYYYVRIQNGFTQNCPADHPKLLSIFPYMLNGYRGWLYDATVPSANGFTTTTTNDQFTGYIACAR